MKPFTKYFLGGLMILSLTGSSCPSNQDSSNDNDEGTDDTAEASQSSDNTESHAFVVTTDFTTGSTAVIDLATRGVEANVGSINSDASATTFGGSIYRLNKR